MHLDEHIAAKKKIYEQYREAFSDIPQIRMNPYLKDSAPNFWLSCMTIDPECGVKPLAIMEAFDDENIESRPIWKPMHMQPVYAMNDFVKVTDGMSVSEEVFRDGLCLPSDIKNTPEDMERIIGIVRSFFS